MESAWEYISSPVGISKWQRCMADFSIELERGGRVSFRICPPEGQSDIAVPVPIPVPIPAQGLIQNPRGLVSECTPPRILAYSFMDPSCDLASHVRFELEERDGKVLLTFTHSHLSPEFMAQVGAGWHVHLDTLVAILNGEEPAEFLPEFVELFKKYSAAIAATLVLSSSAAPAIADSSDTAYKVMSEQRTQLLKSYDRVWKEADDLKYKLAVLARETSQDTDRAEDDLQRELKNKYDDLHRIEVDIRDLDKAVI